MGLKNTIKQCSYMLTQVKGKIYPSGRVSFFRQSERMNRDRSSAIGKKSEPIGIEVDESGQPHLVTLSDVQNCHKKSSPPRIASLTRYAKKSIREGCAVLGSRYGEQRLLFTTMTLPSYPDEIMRYIAESWSNLLRVFFQWYSRLLRARIGRADYLYVSEIQEERSEERDDRLAIWHCHFIAPCLYENGKYIVTADEVRKEWSKLCFNKAKQYMQLTGRLSEEDVQFCNARVYLTKIEKSVAAYMSKYLSKGNKDKDAGEATYEIATQKHQHYYWGMSKDIRQDIKDNTLEFSNQIVDAVEDLIEIRKDEDKSIILWETDITYQYMGEEIKVGHIYVFKKHFAEEIRDLVKYMKHECSIRNHDENIRRPKIFQKLYRLNNSLETA